MIIKNNKYRISLGFGIKIFRSYTSNRFEAILFKFGKRGIWIFKDLQVFNNWPSTNG